MGWGGSKEFTRRQILGIGFGVVAIIVVRQYFQSVNYRQLETFLKKKEWKAADDETREIMLKVARREREGTLNQASLDIFPCEVISNIDRLWVKYSDNYFGFSIQKKIYLELKADSDNSEIAWKKFGDRVGWQHEGSWLSSRADLIFETSAPRGHLPTGCVFWGYGIRGWEILLCENLYPLP
jgi:eukaryotic-like serine/threonine-protein kinase